LDVGEFAQQNKALNYPKHPAVYSTGIWRESLRSYPGRSAGQLPEGDAPPEGTRFCSNTQLAPQKSAEASVSRIRYGNSLMLFLMMRVGPSISVFRHRSQTTFMLLDLRGSVRSDKGKGILKDVRYVVERRTRVNY